MGDPIWAGHARKALAALVAGDYFDSVAAVKAVLEGPDPGDAVPGMMLLWIDSLFAVTRPPTPAFVPAVVPGINDREMWALRMLAARANNDAEQGEQLYQQAVSGDLDQLIEYLVSLLTVIARKLRTTNTEGALYN
jgi:hypothetical protein